MTVTGYEHLINQLDLPDQDDRHVLAAAIHADAQVIVTHNLRDFPSERLAPWGVAAQHPDGFLMGLHQDHPDALGGIIAAITAVWGSEASYGDVLKQTKGRRDRPVPMLDALEPVLERLTT